MIDALIASHLIGGLAGHNLSRSMADADIERTVSVAMRVTATIKRRFDTDAERLIAAHLMGGTSGIDLSRSMTDEEIEQMVSAASRVLAEMTEQGA